MYCTGRRVSAPTRVGLGAAAIVSNCYSTSPQGRYCDRRLIHYTDDGRRDTQIGANGLETTEVDYILPAADGGYFGAVGPCRVIRVPPPGATAPAFFLEPDASHPTVCETGGNLESVEDDGGFFLRTTAHGIISLERHAPDGALVAAFGDGGIVQAIPCELFNTSAPTADCDYACQQAFWTADCLLVAARSSLLCVGGRGRSLTHRLARRLARAQAFVEQAHSATPAARAGLVTRAGHVMTKVDRLLERAGRRKGFPASCAARLAAVEPDVGDALRALPR